MGFIPISGGRVKFVKGATSKYRKRARRPRSTRKMFRGKSKLARQIQAIIARNEETKYIAFDSNDHYVFGNLDINGDGTTLGGNLNDKRLYLGLPALAQGVSAHQRIGNSVRPVKCVVTVQYYFQQAPQSSPATVAGANRPALVEVRQLSVKPKSIKRWLEYNSTTTAAVNGYKYLLPKLLEVGDGTTTAANSANPLNMLYPISNEIWTRCAGNKKFIMGKNGGLLNALLADPSDPLAAARTQNTVRFRVKLPKVLKYDENNSVYPENACPLFGAYAGFINNGSSSITYDQAQQPYFPSSGGVATAPLVGMNYRIELWYKDA